MFITTLILSLLANIFVAIVGILPSYFITAFNISFFGLIGGFFISLFGESLGALFAFILYRKGLKKISNEKLKKHPKITKIINSDKKQQIMLILSFRLIPYMPSGLVTYAASISNMKTSTFVIFSTIGKIPAMILEVLLVSEAINLVEQQNIKTSLTLIAIITIFYIVIKIIKNNKRNL